LAIISTIGTNANCGSNWMGQAFFSLFQTRNFYFATLAGLVCFAFAALLASFSYRYVELPFLQLRRKYVAEDAATMGNALRSDPDSRPPEDGTCTAWRALRPVALGLPKPV